MSILFLGGLDSSSSSDATPDSISLRVKTEIDSWRPYSNALREEDRLVFKEMMNAVSSHYIEAMDQAGRGYDTESLLMSIILSQQRTINWLSVVVRQIREEQQRMKP